MANSWCGLTDNLPYANGCEPDAASPGCTVDLDVSGGRSTAFPSKKSKAVSARLLVRRVPDLNPAHQSALFTAYRYHAVFTDSRLPTVEVEAADRARDRRASHRRPEEQRAGAPVPRALLGLQRLARPGGHRLQPHPRRRRGRRHTARLRDHRDPTRAAHHRPGTTGAVRSAARAAPPAPLAVGARLVAAFAAARHGAPAPRQLTAPAQSRAHRRRRQWKAESARRAPHAVGATHDPRPP